MLAWETSFLFNKQTMWRADQPWDASEQSGNTSNTTNTGNNDNKRPRPSSDYDGSMATNLVYPRGRSSSFHFAEPGTQNEQPSKQQQQQQQHQQQQQQQLTFGDHVDRSILNLFALPIGSAADTTTNNNISNFNNNNNNYNYAGLIPGGTPATTSASGSSTPMPQVNHHAAQLGSRRASLSSLGYGTDQHNNMMFQSPPPSVYHHNNQATNFSAMRAHSQSIKLEAQAQARLQAQALFAQANQTQSQSRSSTPSQRRRWSPEEDNLLKHAVKVHGTKSFAEIAKMVPGRSTTQCYTHWLRTLQPGIKKGLWCGEEDALLVRLVQTQLAAPIADVQEDDDDQEQTNKRKRPASAIDSASGQTNKEGSKLCWNTISNEIAGRSAKQCRERWHKNLDPSLKKGKWETWEDELIVREQERFGNSWAYIARCLPGRTEHHVKTRWRSVARARRRHWTPEEDKELVRLRKLLKADGRTWDDVVKRLNGRTKNAVITRFKVLRARTSAASSSSASAAAASVSADPSDSEVESSEESE